MFVNELARYFDPDRPLYGLQPPPLDGIRPPLRSVEELAATYLGEIRAHQPEGPYCLGGFSFGGLVALEMAQQLQRQGHEVSFLAMFDTRMPGHPRGRHAADAEEADTRHGGPRHSSGEDPVKRWRILRGYQRALLKRVVKPGLANVFLLLGRPVPHVLRRAYWWRVFHRASEGYDPQPYHGPVTLFAAWGRSEYHREAWRSLAMAELFIYEFPTTHRGLIQDPEYATRVVQIMRRHLDDAEASVA